MAADPLGTITETAISEPIGSLAAWGGFVIAASSHGKLLVFASDTLALVRGVGTDFAPLEPRGLAAGEAAIFVSTRKGVGENGSVPIIADWRPGNLR